MPLPGYSLTPSTNHAFSKADVIYVDAFEAEVGDRASASREELSLHPLSKTDAIFVQ